MALKNLRSWRLRCLHAHQLRLTACRWLSQAAAKDSDRSSRPFSEVPGPKGYPLIGTALDYAGKNMNHLHLIMKRRYDKYGAIYREKVFPGMPEQVVIFDPDDVEKVFRSDGEWPNRPEGGEVFMTMRKEAGLDPGILQL